MAPRPQEEHSSDDSILVVDGANYDDTPNNNSGDRCEDEGRGDRGRGVVIFKPTNSPPYLRCNSKESFVNPNDASQINKTLNLNLGIPKAILNPKNRLLRNTIYLLQKILFMWWERYAMKGWKCIPLVIRQRINFWAWFVYLPLHKRLLGKSTGIHKDSSYEYHALTTVMWWGGISPVTVERMRFALSQLEVSAPGFRLSSPRDIKSEAYPIKPYDMSHYIDQNNIVSQINKRDEKSWCYYENSVYEKKVSGWYIQQENNNDVPATDKKVMFWLYGGAYLAGDAQGNVPIAEYIANKCKCDVFIPSTKLMPESNYDEILWDVILSYVYLVMIRNINPKNIIGLGISSGGGLLVRLLQSISEVKYRLSAATKNETIYNDDKGIYRLESSALESLVEQTILLSSSSSHLKDKEDLMPTGGVLLCPFVDYTVPSGSMLEYQYHDLIVNQSVTETGFPYLKRLGKHRRSTSPVYRKFLFDSSATKLCVVVSEHEVCYDETIKLVNSARNSGVDVTLGVWKYLCHVFCMLNNFLPEAEQAMNFVSDWVNTEFFHE